MPLLLKNRNAKVKNIRNLYIKLQPIWSGKKWEEFKNTSSSSSYFQEYTIIKKILTFNSLFSETRCGKLEP